MSKMDNVSNEILITREELQQKVRELAAQITEDFKGEEVLLVGILRGSVPFMADIMREIDLDLTIDFMSVSSYGGSTKTSGVVRIIKDLETPIEGKNVIIIEDIIDTGLTLHYLKGYLEGRHPKALKICAILDKPSRRKIDIKGDYVGFEVDDKFIVGYGLDFNQRYRNLPYISWLRE